MLFALPVALLAQGDLEGRVTADAGRVPVPRAIVRLPVLGRATTSDSLGRFTFVDVASGEQLIVIRALGYDAESTKVSIPESQRLVRDFVLARIPATTLGEVKVTGKATQPKMAGFEDRRRQGIGRFIDRDMLAKVAHRTMSTILATMPGMAVLPGTGMKAWAYTTRAVTGSACAFCGPSSNAAPEDRAAGAKAGFCYMDVMVDGALVYRHDQPAPAQLYDLNSIPSEQLEGIEVFTSTAQMPAQYNRTGSSCGLLVIWTRISK